MKLITIGRDESNDICINSPGISRFHATLMIDGNTVCYVDRSSNGSFINGQRLPSQPVNVYFGQSIMLPGNISFPWDIVRQNIMNNSLPSSKAPTIINSNDNYPEQIIQPQSIAQVINSNRVNSIHLQNSSSDISTKEPNLDKWNWGAFFIYHFWGFGNGTWWLFLIGLFFGWTFIPNIIMGIYGTRMAWRNKSWSSVEAFEQTQHTWACWGVGLFCFGILCMIIFYAILYAFIVTNI